MKLLSSHLRMRKEDGHDYLNWDDIDEVEQLEERIRLLERAITDEGVLTREVLLRWADHFRRKKQGTPIEGLLRRLANTQLKATGNQRAFLVLPESDRAPKEGDSA